MSSGRCRCAVPDVPGGGRNDCADDDQRADAMREMNRDRRRSTPAAETCRTRAGRSGSPAPRRYAASSRQGESESRSGGSWRRVMRRSIASSTGAVCLPARRRDSASVIVRQKKICASAGVADRDRRRQEEAARSARREGPAGSPRRAPRSRAAAPSARGSTRQVQTARMIVRNPTVLAISRWLCS